MTDEEEEPLLAGVSLDQYAGVVAGLGAGVPLPDVLANEQVAPEHWEDAEDAWSTLIDEDETDDDEVGVADVFEERFLSAQDRYARAIDPLDHDLGAWLDFVRVFGEHAEPLTLLGTVGLRPQDLARLHRAWSAELRDDPARRLQAKSALERPTRPLPRITVGPLDMKPQPAVPEPARVAASRAAMNAVDAEADEADEADTAGEASEAPPPPPLFAPLPPPVHAAPAAASPPAARSSRVAVPEPAAPSQPIPPREPASAPIPRDAADEDRELLSFRGPALRAAPVHLEGGLTLAQYAALAAELAVFPSAREETFTRYGLDTEGKRRAVEQGWKTRLANHRDESAKWKTLHDDFVRYHTEQARLGIRR